jgi:carboxyl-terminal processing protease
MRRGDRGTESDNAIGRDPHSSADAPNSGAVQSPDGPLFESPRLLNEWDGYPLHPGISRYRFQRRTLLQGAALGAGVVLSFMYAISQGASAVVAKEDVNKGIYHQLKTFTDVISIVQRDYVSEVDSKKLVEGAIRGMLTSLDPHSGYLDPDFYQDLQAQTKGEFGGLGIEITFKDGLLVVVAPMEDSPAERAGVRAGDVIVKIQGEFTKEFSLVDAVKRLRGPKGTPITISVSRKGSSQLIDLSIVRENISVRSIRSRYLESGFGYIRISQFVEKTSDDLAAAIRKLQRKSADGEIKGLIIDVRNNPGGLLTQAIKVSDMFLSRGVIVYTDGRMESQKQRFYAHPRGTQPEYPIVVLVNGGSASASEIIAGALKDHGRAVILGAPTFGKGSVQTITPLENGGALTLTTALYYTKSGRSIQAQGIIPDIELDVPMIEDEEETLPSPRQQAERFIVRERDLPGAIKNPSGVSQPGSEEGKGASQPPSVKVPRPFDPERAEISDWIARDKQFAKALEVLRGL